MCLQRKPTAVFTGDGFHQATAQPVAIEVRGVRAVAETVRRRRRLWELSSSAACPVLGVGLALPEQRRLMAKCGIDVQGRTDYELHQIAVTECRRRSPFAEKVEQWLDRAYDAELRQSKVCKDADALRAHWQEAKSNPGWAGVMWAVLTHPACLFPLEHDILGDVHMLQHQVGMVTRVEQKRWEALQEKVLALQGAVRSWQERWEAEQRQWVQRQASWAQEVEALRMQWGKEQAMRVEREQQLADLGETMGAQATLHTLREDLRRLTQENHALKRALRHEARQGSAVSVSPSAQAGADEGRQPASGHSDDGRPMQDPEIAQHPLRRVACVGGRTAQLPSYREVVEAHGLELLHHDGGEENNLNLLSATLSAADLVICQVGCVSHNAYWRVKDHCKRQGKPCVFVESASRTALERAMTRIIGTWPRLNP